MRRETPSDGSHLWIWPETFFLFQNRPSQGFWLPALSDFREESFQILHKITENETTGGTLGNEYTLPMPTSLPVFSQFRNFPQKWDILKTASENDGILQYHATFLWCLLNFAAFQQLIKEQHKFKYVSLQRWTRKKWMWKRLQRCSLT